VLRPRGSLARRSKWKYVHVRGLAAFIEESVCRGTKWAVFEPNHEPCGPLPEEWTAEGSTPPVEGGTLAPNPYRSSRISRRIDAGVDVFGLAQPRG
jgi:hypothetical protein